MRIDSIMSAEWTNNYSRDINSCLTAFYIDGKRYYGYYLTGNQVWIPALNKKFKSNEVRKSANHA